MKVYMVMKTRKGVTFTDDDFRVMVEMSLYKVRTSFPNADIINDYESPDCIIKDSKVITEFHFVTNITEREINKVKLIGINDCNILLNKDSYVDSLLVVDGEDSTISSYFVRLQI